ncbi:carbamoyltransferase family protein [Vulcanisaeta distributa]|uniref:Carbamoyltransferase n=1 Tax=Vulcanisaeta distributa (strain DSM 14429 / JCM 11212 / NBRC 100878 / IC-017) TaxID=572478 RepID=E1QTD6_VULDI|nr:carbamoyltransferase C-terminal domain-containing protein [Vulcanisaeta distributa]ADN50929.1 Carbamoyltransferase [Vulcanisaeta distributa DSM 14429]
MIVVGFNWPVEHDHSVAVIVDGELVFASEEERWTRHKHSPGEPPINALKQAFKYLENKYGIKPKDVDAYAVNFDPKLMPHKLGWFLNDTLDLLGIRRFRAYWYEGKSIISSGLELLSYIIRGDYLSFVEHMIRFVVHDLGEEVLGEVRVVPVPHHLAHAASAYYFSGFTNATVLTVDGYGEYESTVVWRVKNGEFEKVTSLPTYYGSIGLLYEEVSWTIGYDHLEGPGKVMGLAPYGQRSKYYEKLRSYFRFDDGDYPYYITVDGSRPRVVKGGDAVYRRPYRLIADSLFPGRVPWDPRGDLNRDAVDLAWAVQAITEEAMLRLAEWARGHTNEQNLALAGGVALNAKANMVIHYSKLFSDMFIFPAANDAGTTVGAAAYVYEHVLGGRMRRGRLRTVYLGPEYGDDEVRKVVERSRFNAEYIGDDVNEVADLVAKGYVVAWYQGRAELGPRALGNRSIVADPRRADMWRVVNNIKGREWWRPLAPSLLVEDASKYFIDPVPHQFMILMFRFREGMKEVVPAVYHVDGTARPQTVAKDENPTWYELIKAFKDITGEGIILNTSFNLAGEPLVETPQDALKSFALGGLDAIYIQGWLIRKR